MIDIDELNALLNKEGKKWRAAKTPLSRLTPEHAPVLQRLRRNRGAGHRG
jgi:hypothetical protein